MVGPDHIYEPTIVKTATGIYRPVCEGIYYIIHVHTYMQRLARTHAVSRHVVCVSLVFVGPADCDDKVLLNFFFRKILHFGGFCGLVD